MNSMVSYGCSEEGRAVLRVSRDPRLNSYYLNCIEQTVSQLMTTERFSLADINLVFAPQISQSFLLALGKRLGVESRRVVDATREDGDLFTSSLPYALRYAHEEKLVRPGSVGLMIGVGAGIQVVCVTYRFSM